MISCLSRYFCQNILIFNYPWQGYPTNYPCQHKMYICLLLKHINIKKHSLLASLDKRTNIDIIKKLEVNDSSLLKKLLSILPFQLCQ